MTTLTTATRTDIGRVRENNEDSVLGSERLAVVADGMGGHPGGEPATASVVSLVQAGYSGRSLELATAVRAANRAIGDRASAQPELEGMGSTISAPRADGVRAASDLIGLLLYPWRPYILVASLVLVPIVIVVRIVR